MVARRINSALPASTIVAVQTDPQMRFIAKLLFGPQMALVDSS